MKTSGACKFGIPTFDFRVPHAVLLLGLPSHLYFLLSTPILEDEYFRAIDS